uniref:Vacuolar protein sorting-associated protein 8 central domain-containing protein n=1 Tax=Pinguiococcus pyrenoidosus TaxID=172671 RepID=A0A7R9Y9X4_9STRA
MSSNLGSAFGLQEKETAQPIFPAFGVRGELFAGAPVVALEWLQTGMLLYLDDDQFMCVYDTYRGCELQNIRLQSLPVHVSFAGLKPEANPRSFSSSFRGCEVGVFLLSTEELRIAKLQTIKQRIDALVDAGEWLSALGLSLDHFDDVIMPRVKRELQQRKARLGRAATSEGSDAGVETSHSSNPEEWTWTEEDRELIELNMNGQRRYTGPEEEAEKLLLVYLDLGVSNAPKEEKGDRRTGYSLANSHYQMLAGVCMEYCCLLRRPDLLFGSVYDRFRKAGRQSVFLDLLEPFITSGQLTTIGAEAMEDFLGMTSSRGDLRSVERSLLRIQVQALDFNRIIPLLRRHKLFSALARVFVKGLGDYLAPVESMAEHVLMEINRDRTLWEKAGTTIRWQLKSEVELELLRSSFGSRANSSQSAASESGWSHWRGSLYKLLLYLKLSFAAKTFPEGSPLPRGELYPPGAVVRAQMLWFVFHPDPSLRIPIPPQKENRIENLRYPVLQAMLMSDTASALEVLSDGIFKASVSEHEILEQDGRTGGTLPAPPAGDAGTGEGKQVDASRPVWEQLRDIGDRVLARLPTNATSATSAGLASGVAAFPEAAIEGNVVEVPRFFAEETDDESVRERCRMYKRSSVWNETSLSWGAELPSISFLVRTVYKTVFHPHAGFSDDVIRACPQYAADARQAVLMFIAKAMLQALDDQVPRLSGNDVTLTLLYRVCAQLIREERDGTTLKFLRSLPSLVLNILTPRLLQTAHDCKRFKVALVLHTRALRCCVLDSPVPPCTAGLYVGEQLGLKLPSSSALGLNATSQEDAAIVPKQHMAASIFSYLRVDAEMPDSALPPRRHRGNPGQHAAPGEDNIGIEDSVFAFLLKQLQELKSFCIRFPDPEEIPTDSRGPAFGLGSPSASIGKGFSSTFLEAVEKLRSADLDMEFTTITGEEFDQTMLDPSLRHELLGADVEILKGWWARRISAAALVREVVQVILAVIGPLIHKDSRMSARLVAELADLLPSLDLESSLRTARSARASKNFMDQVMEALKADPTAQFKLLRVIVNGELNHGEEADPMAANLLTVALTQNDKKFYLNLLAHYQPDSVYDYIVKNDTYALDETLQLCNRLKITDATVYLLERSGDTVGALTMMLTSLSKRLDKLRDLLEKAFRADNGGGLGLGAEDPLGIAGKAKRRVLTSPRSIGVKIQSADAVMLVASTKEGQSIDRAITVVLDICQRNTATIRSMAGTGDLLGAAAGNASSIQRATNHNSVVLRPNVTVSLDPGKDIVATDPPQEAKQDEPAAAEGEGLWFSVLDELLRLRMKYIREDLNSSGGAQREIAMQMQSVVLLLIQRVLNGMMGHVSLENMVTRITERGASVKLGDFRDVLSSLFDAYEYEAEMYRHASQIVRKNVALRKMQQLVVQRSGVPIQRVDDTPLPYSLKDWGHGGPPKIIFRGRGVLSVNPETASAETVIIGSRKSQSESSEGATKDSGMNPFLARRLRKRRTFLKAQLQVTSLSSYKGEISKNWRPFGAHPTAPLSIRNATSKSQREMPKLSPNASSFPARATYVREVNPIDAAGLT